MDTVLLQKQIRDNAEDLRSYLQDLKNWESEMKRKEAEIHSGDSGTQSHPPVRSKIKKLAKEQKKCESQTEKSSKISGFDYASWDKFDVDKACEELDNDQENSGKDVEDLFNEIEEERRKEEAIYEKERGNDFVKKQKWKEAIQCYSRAIKCYPHDAIFYANRALCYLKIQDLKSAEADSTAALQLDPNYVKAYQRRAMARAGLGQLLEARTDLLKVMEIEPKNMASKAELLKIEKKINLKSDGKINKETGKQGGATSTKNTAFKSQPETKSNKELHSSEEKPIDDKEVEKSVKTNEEAPKTSNKKCEAEVKNKTSISINKKDGVLGEKSRLTDNKTIWPNDDVVKLVKPIEKAPHLRSKKPLKRISIQEIDNSTLKPDERVSELSVTSIMKKEYSGNEESSVETKSFNVKEQEQDKVTNYTYPGTKSIVLPSPEETLKLRNAIERRDLKSNVEDNSSQVPPAPTTSVQFYVGWKKVKSNPQLSYLYLKQIPGSELARLFGDSLESSTFSEIISILETHCAQFIGNLLPYIIGFTKVRRFSALVMFLSQADKAGVKKLLQYCKDQGECSDEQCTELLRTYEL